MPINEILQQLDEQIRRLQQARRLLTGSNASGVSILTIGRRGPRHMSAEARQRIAAAQRARWARQKGQSTVATKSPVTSISTGARRGPRRLSAAARARIAAAQRARWAKVRGQKKKAA